MLKEELVKWVQKAFVGDAREKEILSQYITRATDILPQNLTEADRYYGTLDGKRFAFEPETREILCRLLRFLSCHFPHVLHSSLAIVLEERYGFFRSFDLSDSFVKQDLIYKLTGKDFEYWSNYVHDKYYDTMSQVFNHYPQVAYSLFRETEQETGKMQAIFVFLLTFIVRKQQEQGISFDERFETVVFALIRTQFSEEEIEKIFVRYQTTPETLKRFQNGSSFHLGIDPKQCEILLYIIFNFCQNITPVTEDAICLAMLLKPVRSVCIYNDTFNMELIHKHSLSWIVPFRHLIYKSICRWQNSTESLVDVVESCLATHEREYFYLLNDFKESGDFAATPLVAQLLKEGRPEGAEHLAWLNERLAEAFNKYLWEDALVGILSEKYQALARNFDLNDRRAQAPVFKPFGGMHLGKWRIFDTYEMMLSSIYLMDYSVIALNIVKLILKNLKWHLFDGVNLFVTCNFFRKNSNKNVFSFLYETGLQFDIIIRAFLNQYHYAENIPPALQAQFLEFLIQHKEEAENAIPFLDINDYCMIDYLKNLFEVSQCCNIKKALLAFQKKTPVVLKYLVELLEDKEAFVRQEVETLQNSKHKGTSETAAKIVRLWHSKTMGAP